MLFNNNTKTKQQTTSNVWQSLKSGLNKTRDLLFTDIGEILSQENYDSDILLDELENRLLFADVGIDATEKIISGLKSEIKKQKPGSSNEILDLLNHQMMVILKNIEAPLKIPNDNHKPFTILVVGVNGAGKTTTIGKLTNLYKNDYKTMIAAGDTFRAAAIDQLAAWGEKNAVPVISKPQGSDSAAVIYDALQNASQHKFDLLIADTAGRLQNKSNLIDELKKIRKTISKFNPELPVVTLLIIDAATGQMP